MSDFAADGLLGDLERAQQAYAVAAEHTEDLRRQRAELITLALEHGHRPADIARVLGVSRARVAQLSA